MNLYEDLKSGAGKLIDTAVDVYKTTLEADAEKKAISNATQIEQSKADDIVKIGGFEVSVTKVLLIFGGTMLVLLLTRK